MTDFHYWPKVAGIGRPTQVDDQIPYVPAIFKASLSFRCNATLPGFSPRAMMTLRQGGTNVDPSDPEIIEYLETEPYYVGTEDKSFALNFKTLTEDTVLTIKPIPVTETGSGKLMEVKAPVVPVELSAWGTETRDESGAVVSRTAYAYGDACGQDTGSYEWTPSGCWRNDHGDGFFPTDVGPDQTFYYIWIDGTPPPYGLEGAGSQVATFQDSGAFRQAISQIPFGFCFNDHVEYSYIQWKKWLADPTLLRKTVDGVKRQFTTFTSEDDFWNPPSFGQTLGPKSWGLQPFVPKKFNALETLPTNGDDLVVYDSESGLLTVDFSKTYKLPEGVSVSDTKPGDRPQNVRVRNSKSLVYVRYWLVESAAYYGNVQGDYGLGIDIGDPGAGPTPAAQRQATLQRIAAARAARGEPPLPTGLERVKR